ncbi:hypothetical protein CTRI78_v006013 [Colletotrichum trifolii]|uniref:Helicase ATP-binding domain-containing protein n=1 Tax=Colletotrichum trifolii TaxID=5466 RepID=A0A4V3HW45_COLTR|nr:hypothetical protein CTRI78_v006013 [Colletotrichum trifolii]
MAMAPPDWHDATLVGPDLALTAGGAKLIHKHGRRYCLCDAYRKHMHAGTFYRCQRCHEMRCSECRGNPDHVYDETPVDVDFHVTKNDAQQQAVAAFPGTVTLTMPTVDEGTFGLGSGLAGLGHGGHGGHGGHMARAINVCVANYTFYQTRLEFKDDVCVTYESRDAYVVVVVNEASVAWNVYLRQKFFDAEGLDALQLDGASPQLALSTLGYDFGRPILRSELFVQSAFDVAVSQSPLHQDGRLVGFEQHVVDLDHDLDLDLDHDNLTAPQSRIMAQVTGRFRFSNTCATPGGLVYTREDGLVPAAYHLLDAHNDTDPKDDRWVLSSTPRKMEAGHVREVLLTYPGDYTHPLAGDFTQQRDLKATVPGIWFPLAPDIRIHVSLKAPPSIQLANLGSKTAAELSCGSSESAIRLFADVCGINMPVRSLLMQWLQSPPGANFGGPRSASARARRRGAAAVPEHLAKDALELVSFALTRIRANDDDDDNQDEDEDDNQDEDEDDNQDKDKDDKAQKNPLVMRNQPLGLHDACASCAPEEPHLHHLWCDDGTVERVLDRDMAAARSHGINQRRPAFDMFASLRASAVPNRFLFLDVVIGLNPLVLAHAAMGHLQRSRDPIARRLRDDAGVFDFDVAFGVLEPSLKALTPFRQGLRATTACDLDDDQDKAQPPSFQKMGKSLRPDQMAALSWMVRRERKQDGLFTERETEECVLPAGRVRIKATAKTRTHARGGVLAHEVGYGKTVVTLGAIDKGLQDAAFTEQLLEDRRRIVADSNDSNNSNNSGNDNIMIHTRATLIIVPPHIVDQWRAECRQFLGARRRVHVIKTVAGIQRRQIEQADIVIVSSSVFSADRVLERIAEASGLPAIHRNRRLEEADLYDWHAEAVETMRGTGFDFGDPEGGTAEGVEGKIREIRAGKANWARVASESRVGLSSRKKQATTTKTKAKTKTTSKTKAKANKTKAETKTDKIETKEPDAQGDDKTKTETKTKAQEPTARDKDKPGVADVYRLGLLLELYSFARVVLDEFSYESKHVAVFFKQAVSSCKWILSGTPPTSDLAHVCDMAALLNTHVARAAPTPGYFPNVTSGPRAPALTDEDEFHGGHAEPISAHLALERHRQAHRWLGHFVRKNLTDAITSGSITTTEVVCIVPMGPRETLVYTAAQQALADADWDRADMAGFTGELVTGALRNEDRRAAAARVKGSGRTGWSDALDALLILSSVSAGRHGRRALLAMGWLNDDDETETQAASLRNIVDGANAEAYESLDRLSRVLASHWNMMMFLRRSIALDDSPRSSGRRDKEKAYTDHMDGLVDIFRRGIGELCGGGDCFGFVLDRLLHQRTGEGVIHQHSGASNGRDLWDPETWYRARGGPGQLNFAAWWPVVVDKLTEEDLVDVLRPDDTPEEDREKAMADLVEHQQEEYGKKVMAEAIGLRKKTRDEAPEHRLLDAHLNDDTTKDDYELGVKMPPGRPVKGNVIRPRGQPIDETLNSFMLAVQSVKAGIDKVVAATRRSVFHAKLACLVHGRLDMFDGAPVRCNACPATVIECSTDGFLSSACGHVLCAACHSALRRSGNPLCPSTDGCTSPSAGTFIPFSCLVPPTRNLDLDLTLTHSDDEDNDENDNDDNAPSSKVAAITRLILHELPAGEKALVFVSHQALKSELYAELDRHRALVAAFVTNGGHADADHISGFKDFRGKAVLVQSLMSAESAGTNLTEANHLVFADVLCTDRDNYAMYTNQARGRVVRQGQARIVRVYQFVTPATVEWEVLDRRLGGRLRSWGDQGGGGGGGGGGRVALPIPEDAPVHPEYPVRFRAWIEGERLEPLLRSVEVDEFEM